MTVEETGEGLTMGDSEGKLELCLKLTGMGQLGEALARYDGQEAFVFGGIPGEEVLAEIVRRHRGHIAARVVTATVGSPHRVEAPCPYFGPCTGCQWQHISYRRQLELKREVVRQALAREGGMADAPVAAAVPASQVFGYRNHARFTVGPEGSLGFVNRQTRRFVRIDRCLLMHPWINQALSRLQGHCGETTQLSIRYGTNTGDWLIQPALKSAGVALASGQGYYHEALWGKRFRISSPSFFQVNTAQAERMAEVVRQCLALTGEELLVDAYAGVGTFSVLLSAYARNVLAIEVSASAIEDAEVNVQGLTDVKIVHGEAEKLLGSLTRPPDALVLDPPRSGCQPQALQALLMHPPRRIAYVSCDPNTLARDLKVLCHGPFVLEEVTPVDLFPQTHHVECVAALVYSTEREQSFRARQRLFLASQSPRRREIMATLGLSFQVVPSEVEEPLPASGDPAAIAQERARHKARAAAGGLHRGMVIGADTIVADGDELLGKPSSEEEAFDVLRRLRGKEHRVVTGLALVNAATGEELTGYRVSRVRMRQYSDEEIADYIASGSPWDKAGAYGIQDADFHPVVDVVGCYLNVVGLPPCVLVILLHQMGVFPSIDPDWTPPGRCPDCRRISRAQ
ncbi:MAG: septum formation protein Maf [Chloroflexi bacterium]|nr:septum formation protein Maf [Chloroflexota bacterium]